MTTSKRAKKVTPPTAVIDDYAVGYGKPPKHSRFQPGQSGNPKGRPKGSLNLAMALNRALREKVPIIEHGRPRLITKLDAAVKGLVNRAVKGDAKAMQQMLGLSPLVGMEEPGPSTSLEAQDAAILSDLLKRLDRSPTESSHD